MSTSKIPTYVSKAAGSLKGAQFTFIMSAVVWAYQQQIAGTPGSGTAMGRAISAEHPELSEKTLSNYCATAVTLARQHAQVLAPMWAEPTNKPEHVLRLFGDWIKSNTAAKGYTLSEPDLRAHADGKPSMAAKAQAERDAQAQIAAAAAAAASKPESKPEPATPEGSVSTTPATGKDPHTLAEIPANPPAPVDAPKEAPAKPEEAPAPVTLFTARRMPDGSMSMILSAGVTRAELVAMALHLESVLDTMPAPAPAPAQEQAPAPAPVEGKGKGKRTKPEPVAA